MSIGNSIGNSIGASIGSSIGEGGLVAGALVHFNETSIVGATPVTQLTNIGTGDATHDLDTVVGTAADLVKTTVNGIAAVQSVDISVGIETSAAVNIVGGTTEFLVFRLDQAATSDFMMDSQSGFTDRHTLVTGATQWSYSQGSTVLVGTRDTNLHLHTMQWNQDATSKFTVSGQESVTGDAGSQDFDFGAFFMNASDGNFAEMTFCEYLLYNSTLNDSEIAQNQDFLEIKWGI